ncbi:MAG: sulfatase-like hydrolase/transferase, partial [Novosphingobium sp.]
MIPPEAPPPGDGSEKGYVFDRDMADHALGWLKSRKAGKPSLMYCAPGTAHAPLQAPREWIDRFRGRFDGGWDFYRKQALARQKAMGL